jgi:acyl-CoA thioesterase YciA
MDLAAGISSKMATRGRLVTVAIQNVDFISPVKVGATVSCYTKVVNTGKISVQINVEVWTSNISIIDKPTKMAGG